MATQEKPTEQAPQPAQGRLQRLLAGQSGIDFIGRSRLWLALSLAIIAVCVLGVLVRGLSFGIDFTGGTSYTVTNADGGFTSAELRNGLAELGVTDVSAQVVDGGAGAIVTTPPREDIGGAQDEAIFDRVAEITGVSGSDITTEAVGPSWGDQISRQAVEGLVIFLVLVVAYISFRFELRMAVAAVTALLHDIVVTVGIYALVGFEVTPASVIALLTILGYSLYDTVVVFDRVTEDTAGLRSVSTESYGQVSNRALNAMLVRSISTSVTSLLPVGSLLFIGATLLGADTLSDLALALFLGMAAGTYSSVMVATPLLVWLKEREPQWAELKAKVASRRGEAATVQRR
jgi:preprotein translocase subunit SecF